MLAAAGNAPFHYACDRVHLAEKSSPAPWRAYCIDAQGCNDLMKSLIDSGDTTKVPNMLAAAEFLVQVTWLPDAGTIQNRNAGKDEPAFVGTQRNMEHLAAASAFAQSLLLAGEAEGFRTYWSSGGPLRSEKVFAALGIPETEILLGSIFLFPGEHELPDAETRSGGMREKRGEIEAWSRWCQFS